MLKGCSPWPKKLAERYVAQGYWENLTLGDILDRSARFFPEREALVGISPVKGEVRDTYRELYKKVNRLAHHLLRLGLEASDRVILQLPNIPEFVYTYFALNKIGAIPVLCLPPHRLSEIGYIAQHTEAKGYAIPSEFRKFNYLTLAKEVKALAPSLELVLVAGDDVPEGAVALAELSPITTGVLSNEAVAELCQEVDCLIPFCSINPFLDSHIHRPSTVIHSYRDSLHRGCDIGNNIHDHHKSEKHRQTYPDCDYLSEHPSEPISFGDK